MDYAKRYLLAFVVFLVLDMIWLVKISPSLYKRHIGHLMAEKVNIPAAAAFYLLFIAALLFFVVDPALAKGSLTYALFAGGFFGLALYATYDLTNLATLRDWPVFITVVDLVWGTFVCSATSAVVTAILMRR